jgi:hypothetical protein
VCGAAKEGTILEQYVDRLSGKPAVRPVETAVVVEVFLNNAD